MKLFDKETVIFKHQNVGMSTFLQGSHSFKRYKYFPWIKVHRVCQIIGHKGVKMIYSGDEKCGGVVEFMNCERCGLFLVNK